MAGIHGRGYPHRLDRLRAIRLELGQTAHTPETRSSVAQSPASLSIRQITHCSMCRRLGACVVWIPLTAVRPQTRQRRVRRSVCLSQLTAVITSLSFGTAAQVVPAFVTEVTHSPRFVA